MTTLQISAGTATSLRGISKVLQEMDTPAELGFYRYSLFGGGFTLVGSTLGALCQYYVLVFLVWPWPY